MIVDTNKEPKYSVAKTKPGLTGLGTGTGESNGLETVLGESLDVTLDGGSTEQAAFA